MQLKEQAYHRNSVARELKHDVDMDAENVVSGTRWQTSQRRKEYLRSGRLAVSRKNQHPQLGWERNLQLSGTMVPGK